MAYESKIQIHAHAPIMFLTYNELSMKKALLSQNHWQAEGEIGTWIFLKDKVSHLARFSL